MFTGGYLSKYINKYIHYQKFAKKKMFTLVLLFTKCVCQKKLKMGHFDNLLCEEMLFSLHEGIKRERCKKRISLYLILT